MIFPILTGAFATQAKLLGLGLVGYELAPSGEICTTNQAYPPSPFKA